MMAILPMPSSIELHSNTPVSKANFAIKGRKLSHVAAVAAIKTATPRTSTTNQTRTPLQLINTPCNNNSMFDEFSLNRAASISDRILIKELAAIDVRKTGFSELKFGTKAEGLGREVGIVIQRLEAVGERVRELEREKLVSRMKGELSEEESRLVEKMGREIISRFLDKPIQFLRNGDGDLEERLKEMNFLVAILEESCPMKEKI